MQTKNKLLTDMSLDELKTKEKQMRTTVTAFIIMIVMLFAAGMYLLFKQGWNVFTFLPVVFLPLLIFNAGSLKKIRSEIVARNA